MASFSSSDDDGDVDWNAKGTTTKTKSKQSQQKRRVKKPKIEEKEEGEVEDDDDDQFDDGYDENLMGDEEDQRRLAQMTEKEREQELFNRSEKRERMRTRFEIERKLRLAKKKELEKLQEQKRQRLRASDIYSDSDDDSSSDEDSSPTHHHGSNHNDHHSAPATRNSTANNNNNTTTPNSGGLSNDDDSHDDNDSDDEQSDREDEEEVEEFEEFDIKLPDLKSVQLKRDMIEEWCHAPFFKGTAIGLFVKISVGNHPQTKGHVYKVAQIIDVIKTPKAYNLGKTRTDKGAVLKLGRIERTYQMLYISNSPFDENDLIRWKEQMQNDNCDLPGREHFSRKKQDLFNAINYEYKDADIEAMLAEKNRFKETPYNFAMRKTKLMADKADAELDGNHALALKIQQEIDMVEDKAKHQEKLRSSSTFSAISFVNERNRLRNIAEAEKVLMESKNVRTEDPFTRRKCTPTIVHKFSKNNMLPPNSGSMSPSLTPTDSPSNTNAKKEDQVDGRNGNVNTVGATPLKSATDLFAAHDDIELDLDLELSV